MYEYRYVLPVRAGKWHFEQACLWISEHEDKYGFAEEKSKYCRCYENTQGKRLQISLYDGELTVNSEDDLREYFETMQDVLTDKNSEESRYRSKENKGMLLLASLGFYTLAALLPSLTVCFITSIIKAPVYILYCTVTAAVMTASYDKIQSLCGDSSRSAARSVIIQAGGVFALIPAVGFLIFVIEGILFTVSNETHAYDIYFEMHGFLWLLDIIGAVSLIGFVCHILIFPLSFLLSEIMKHVKSKLINR